MSDQVGSGLDHPACPTRGAETAALAAECNEMLVAAGIALNAQEAMLEEAALQVVVELPLDERGERAALGFESSEELWAVGLDDRIEWCLFSTVAFVDMPVGAAGLWQSS